MPGQVESPEDHLVAKARRCNRPKSTGGYCAAFVKKGTDACAFHSMKSPTRLHSKADPIQDEAYDKAVLDSLEHEIRYATVQLAWAHEQWEKNPTGGVTVSGKRAKDGSSIVHVYPYSRLVMEHTDHLRRLKLAAMSVEKHATAKRELATAMKFADEWKPAIDVAVQDQEPKPDVH